MLEEIVLTQEQFDQDLHSLSKLLIGRLNVYG